MNKVSFILIFTYIFAMPLFAACAPAQPSVTSSAELAGSQDERVAHVTAILNKISTPPTTILDANLLEERIGDGNLGPSDVRTYIQLQVTPTEIARWQEMLTTLPTSPSFVAPANAPSWWIEESEFGKLGFYEPTALIGANGWVAIGMNQGTIYIYSFTT